MKVEHYTVDGVFVEHAAPDGIATAPPIVFVHGGSHGSWLWENWLPYFAGKGRHCYAFSWFNHTGSRALPTGEFVQRGMLDATRELDIVVSHINETPVLMAHSMGAAVTQKYSEDHSVLAQVLLAPVPSTESKGEPIPLPVDWSAPFPPMPYDMAVEWFLAGCPEEDARRYYGLMPDESPKAVWEAAQRGAAIELDRTRIGGPTLMVAGGKDIVSPADLVRRHAAHFGADYLYLADRAHSLILEPRWHDVADRVNSWLSRTCW
ncbi:alpha/beta hydrolase [Streptomyces camponoticapitis]|uniref:Alpha/beta hydrolase n=1 Tax=Streptomyces camponoticapitis TaxID=1616125 RepID=A0ABQ2EX65_9ACTN|nr:alpha/beta fold hydrolase [Streptomyces camponoticapitis]GGK30742.1 alpha/beta hydrolase [Streptomyces camponoticapitis]